MLTPDERRAAMAMGIALRMKKQADAADWIGKLWKGTGAIFNLIGTGAKWSTVGGLGLGVPVGALWFAMDRARKNRTMKEREKEQETMYYKDYLQSVGAE